MSTIATKTKTFKSIWSETGKSVTYNVFKSLVDGTYTLCVTIISSGNRYVALRGATINEVTTCIVELEKFIAE